MIIHEVQQGTEEWRKLRLGKFTGSNFGNLFSKETTASYQDTINQVVYERLTNTSPENFKSKWMERGNELEAMARDAYELLTFNKVREIGFIELNEWVGISPDGLIDEDGTLEIKVPKFSTLIDYKLTGKIPSSYLWQIQGGLYVSERQWCDFFVYDPNMKPLLLKIYRDEKKIDELKLQLEIVINEAQTRIKKLKEQN